MSENATRSEQDSTGAGAAKAIGKRGKSVCLLRPWWSRAPEQPAFMPPPEEGAASSIPRAYVVIVAIVFAIGVFFLGRYARRSA